MPHLLSLSILAATYAEATARETGRARSVLGGERVPFLRKRERIGDGGRYGCVGGTEERRQDLTASHNLPAGHSESEVRGPGRLSQESRPTSSAG